MRANRKALIMASDLAYIRRHWAVLAAEAWRGYLECGRGAILIDLGSGLEPLASYCTRLGDAPEAWPSPTIALQVRQYDPLREVVFLALRDDVEVLTYRLEADVLPPPRAYAQLRTPIFVPAA